MISTGPVAFARIGGRDRHSYARRLEIHDDGPAGLLVLELELLDTLAARLLAFLLDQVLL